MAGETIGWLVGSTASDCYGCDEFRGSFCGTGYRGCAVSVAWKVLKAEEKHAGKPEWQALLKRFQGLVPKGWTVIVLADRGLYAKWLFEAIVELTWHPFLRVNSQGTFGREGWYHWQPFSYWVPAKGCRWQGRGIAFKGKKSQLRCTLLGYWGKEHQDPWLVLTELAPECADACWYGLRAWIEQGFKHIQYPCPKDMELH